MKLRYCQKQYTVNFNVQELSEGDYKYRWQSVKLPPGVWNYGQIVSAIVAEKYTEDRMQAVINNFLIEPKTMGAMEEMRDMQVWRRFAKQVAKDCINAME